MSSVMTYEGYTGSVSYSEEDEVFHGKIEAINDLIMFEGTSVNELKEAFHEAVDDYVETCKEMSREPQKPFKGSFNVRVTSDLHRKAVQKATMLGVSLNQFVQKGICYGSYQMRDVPGTCAAVDKGGHQKWNGVLFFHNISR